MQFFESEKLSAYWLLMRADKPIGTYLLLWPTLWGLLIAANGWPGLHITLVFVLGVVLMRAAGCVINDYADRKIDGHVKRTQQRPLVSGAVTEKEALQLFALLCFTAFLLVLTLSWQTVALSFVALALAFSYPFMKRYTHLPQFVLGAAFSFGIPMAFMEISQSIPWWAWVLYVANLSWTVAYDTMYAIVDRDDDLKIGVKSTAILFGEKDKLIIGLLQIVTLALLALVFMQIQLAIIAFASLLVAAGLFLKQQKMIALRDRDACFAAFLHNNKVGLVVTLGIALDLLFKMMF